MIRVKLTVINSHSVFFPYHQEDDENRTNVGLFLTARESQLFVGKMAKDESGLDEPWARSVVVKLMSYFKE